MSTYELDDELVRSWVEGDGGLAPDLGRALREQLPQETPTRIGAVVTATYTGEVFTRWAVDETTDVPWIDSADGELVSTAKLERIIKVLSEGVDL